MPNLGLTTSAIWIGAFPIEGVSGCFVSLLQSIIIEIPVLSALIR